MRCILGKTTVDAERLYREAQEAIRARDEFLSIASHELRTPLTALSLHVQGLMRILRGSSSTATSSLAGAKFEAVERQIVRLTNLVNNLLDVSRISTHKLQLDYERVDLAELAREVCGRLTPEAVRAGCMLAVHTDGEVMGTWDRLRLDQVVTNLVTNAVKYGAGKPVDISVRRQGTSARLMVCDHGIGIDPEDQARIFDRFERAVSEHHYGGLGLGLWIVRQILDALGGTIRVESQPGKGATFIVVLPRDPA